MGFLSEGELFVTGPRLRDLIIIRGRNHHPEDLELSVAFFAPPFDAIWLCSSLLSGCRQGGTSSSRRRNRSLFHMEQQDIVRAIRNAIAREHEVHAYSVVLVKRGTLPRTSSGKIQRHLCHEQFIAKMNELTASTVREPLALEPALDSGSPTPARSLNIATKTHLRALIANVLNIGTDLLSEEQPLTAFGLDSLMALQLKHEVESQFGVVVPLVKILEEGSLSSTGGVRAFGGTRQVTKSRKLDAAVTVREFPLSHGQRALWFLHQHPTPAAPYNLSRAFRVRSQLNLAVVREVLQMIVDRHEALRTWFGSTGHPVSKSRALRGCFPDRD